MPALRCTARSSHVHPAVLINVACPLIDPPVGDVITDVTPFMRVTPRISLSTLSPTSARMCGLN